MSLMSAAEFTGGLLCTVAFQIIFKNFHLFLRLASSRVGDKEGFYFIKIPGDFDEHSFGNTELWRALFSASVLPISQLFKNAYHSKSVLSKCFIYKIIFPSVGVLLKYLACSGIFCFQTSQGLGRWLSQ